MAKLYTCFQIELSSSVHVFQSEGVFGWSPVNVNYTKTCLLKGHKQVNHVTVQCFFMGSFETLVCEHVELITWLKYQHKL